MPELGVQYIDVQSQLSFEMHDDSVLRSQNKEFGAHTWRPKLVNSPY